MCTTVIAVYCVLSKRNETTSLRWRAHAAKAAVNYHTLDDISEKDEDKEEKQARGRLCCCGAQHVVLDGVAAAAGTTTLTCTCVMCTV
jgi:hypothetical protein